MKKHQLKNKLSAFALAMFNNNLPDQDYYKSKIRADELIEELIDDLEISFEPDCEFCDDEGVVYTDETDESRNVSRGVNTKKCICKLTDEEEF